jgi:hypothetical protein
MAADFRESFTQYNDIAKKELPYGYVDSIRKIFPLGDFQVGISGTPNVGNIFWWHLVEKYDKKHIKESSLEAAFNRFKYFLKYDQKIPDSAMPVTAFVLAEYENKRPAIMVVDSISQQLRTRQIG